MSIRTAYAQAYGGASNTSNYSYALTTPALGQSGAWAVFELSAGNAPLQLNNVWAGKKGGSNGAFDGAQVQLLFGGAPGVSLAAGQRVWSDPVLLTLTSGVPAVLRYDIPNVSGQNYPLQDGVVGSALQYKSGNLGAANGDTALASGFTTMSGWSAVLRTIRVADALADFSEVPVAPAALSLLAELEARGITNQLGSTGKKFAGVPGERTAFSYQLAVGKAVRGYVDLIMMTADADCEVILIAANAPAEAVIFNSHCNTNFLSGAPGPNSRMRHWTTLLEPDVIGGRHTSFMLKANQPTPLFAPRGFLGIIYPGGGLAWVINEPGVGAHVSVEWHEVPL